MSHVLDADVLIEARKRYYRFGVCPGYWEWLEQAHAEGKVYSLDVVRQELLNYGTEDDLVVWAKGRPSGFFQDRDEETVEALRKIADWTMGSSHYFDAAKSDFLATDKADAWLVAHGLAHGVTVVTHEQPNPERKKSIKIPDACDAHGVEWMNMFDFLERHGAVFDLQ